MVMVQKIEVICYKFSYIIVSSHKESSDVCVTYLKLQAVKYWSRIPSYDCRQVHHSNPSATLNFSVEL